MPPPPDTGMARFLDAPAAHSPDKTALIDDGGAVTFAEAARMANRLARAFARLGAARGDRVALILPNGVPFVLVEIAIVRGGMVKVPLNIRFHIEEVLYSLADCEPALLICDGACADAVLARRDRLPSLKSIVTVGGRCDGCERYEDIVAGGDAAAPAVAYGDDDPILIRYTGGTTGRPKGIVHTHASFLSVNRDVLRELRLTADDVVLNLGHLSHGLNFMWGAHYGAGSTQILRERFEPARVLDDVERHRVSFVYMVPTMVQRLLREDDGRADLSSLRMLLYASAPMPAPALRAAIERFGPVCVQVYTLSEAPVITTILRPDEHVDLATPAGNRLESCGRAVATMELRLIDDDGAEVAPGAVGEIAVRSVNNMAGYWRRPAETAATLVDGWVLTGDMARRDDDGYFYIVDRKKDVIITGAFNVYPKEVEDVLYRHPAVAQAAVVGAPDDEWGEAVKAFVVLRPGRTATAQELTAFCGDFLAGYKKPRAVEFLDTLPLSPVGKVTRRALRERGPDLPLGEAGAKG